MLSGMGREILDEIRSDVQEMVQKQIDDEVFRIQKMDIMRVAALLDANVREETIERLLCKY